MDEATLSAARRWLDHCEQDRLTTSEREASASPAARDDESDEGRILATLREGLAALSEVEGKPQPDTLIDDLRSEIARLRTQLALARTAYDYLLRLAHHYSGEEPILDSPEQIRAFCERIKRATDLLVEEVKALLTGRKKIQTLLSLVPPASDESGGMTRQIRLGDLHGDLGRRLFDWRGTTLDDSLTAELRNAIDELKHHQLALMAGYEQCVRAGALAVLQPLDPAVLSREFVDSLPKAGSGLRRLIPLKGCWLWRRYRRRYAEIIAEDDRWFQARFLPAFQQGYRDYMRTRARAAHAATAPGSEGG